MILSVLFMEKKVNNNICIRSHPSVCQSVLLVMQTPFLTKYVHIWLKHCLCGLDNNRLFRLPI